MKMKKCLYHGTKDLGEKLEEYGATLVDLGDVLNGHGANILLAGVTLRRKNSLLSGYFLNHVYI